MQIMKKSLAVFLAVLMLLSAMSLVSFAASGTAGPHDHQYNTEPDIVAVAPTCTTAGHGQGWTCTVEGCGQVKWEAGDFKALGHLETVIPAVQPTCTQDGSTEGLKCTRPGCGEILKAPEKIDKLDHAFGDWVVVKQPTGCREQGEKQRRCSRCGETEYDWFLAEDHKWETVPAVPVTCTKDGAEAGRKCTVCGTVEGCAVIKSSGHDYEKVKTEEPTCDTVGKTTYKCKVCGELHDDDIKPALQHIFVTDEAVEATCQKEGKTEGRHCERCGKVFLEQKTIPKTDHAWVVTPAVAPTCTEKGYSEGKTCKYCGTVSEEVKEIAPNGHNFTTKVITPVTCEANGLTMKYCTDCNVSETVVVAATGHKLDKWTYSDKFSCENGGERWQVCENCGEIFNREQVPAAGHMWDKEWTIDTPATCTTKGYKSHHCTVCGKKTDITTIAKTPHQYLNTVVKATTKKSGLVTGVCAVCGLERKPITVNRVASFKLSKTSYVYDGKAKKPTVVVKDSFGNKLKSGTDYKVSYASGRKKVGTYTVKITLIGNYSGSKTLKFTIKLGTPKGLEAKTNATKKTITLSYAAVKGAKKYVIYCATEKNGSYKKLVTTKKTACKITTLKPGTYYFKVRALTTNNNGKNAYSAYSSPLKVKLAKVK